VDGHGGPGRIGPNAVLQLISVLERAGGEALPARLCAAAGLGEVRGDRGLIDEAPVARLHALVRAELPDPDPILREAGLATGAYILANRIPGVVRGLLKLLPPPIAARLLAQAIAKHAWTFAGTGAFRVVDPRTFELENNPLIRGEAANRPLCVWHAGVFERLYQTLVDRRLACAETACAAQGAPACRFELRRR
jgi:divinyl protochlorophyllide a 8-vinyl-reductase